VQHKPNNNKNYMKRKASPSASEAERADKKYKSSFEETKMVIMVLIK
jgi:hypothetical protein